MRLAVILLAVLLLAPAPAHAAAGAGVPLAIVAAAKGRVDIGSGHGGAVRATFGRALQRGDRVTVASGGSATIFFNDGNVIELGPGSSMTIGGRAAEKSHGELAGEVYASVNRFVAGGSRESGLVGQSPMRGGTEAAPLLLRPRGTSVASTPQRFEWRHVEGATRYRVAVSGEQGELWSREVGDTTLDYPKDAPPLPAGADVEWSVRALGEQDELLKESAVLHVLSAEQGKGVSESLARIEQAANGDPAAAAFLAGSYLYGQGLYDDSAARFEALVRLAPDAPAPHEALAQAYRSMGLTARADAQQERAKALAN
jgi:hypothetical protein